LAVFALENKDSVKTFLLTKGVEAEGLDTKQFNVTEKMSLYVDKGSERLACGTCLKLRQSEGSEMCPLSTTKDI